MAKIKLDQIDQRVKDYFNSNKYKKTANLHYKMSDDTKKAISEININIINMEVKMAKFEQKLEDTCESMNRVESKMDDFIKSADNKYADKENFVFWRNLLVSGIVLTIFVGVIMIWFDNFK